MDWFGGGYFKIVKYLSFGIGYSCCLFFLVWFLERDEEEDGEGGKEKGGRGGEK